MVPLELSKDNNQYCKISVFMPNAGSINESVISVTNVGGDSFSVAVSMIRWNANKVFCKLINGTKISNINMYYTVDTERFCFYIKANWYAKIIVSRLGLVNTSKIESINAIPSGAIEVPISWRDKRYSTELGELIGTATGNKSGLMSVEDKKRLGRRFFKGYTKLVESKYWYNHYVALIFGASPASNLGSLIAIDWKGNELISVTRFFGNNDNVKLYLGSNPETNMYELWLGLIGLDGDGSEFIIQSRESIDLDSKTVETLPSYLKVISISWQKNNDFSELGELLQNENYIRMAEGRGSATLYRIDFMRNLNLVVKIVGEGNSEVVDDYSIICMHGGGNGLCITHNSGPSSIRMYRDNDYNYYVYVSGWGYAIAYFANRIPIYNAISATKVDIDIRTLEQVGI